MAALAQTRDRRFFKRRPRYDRMALLSIGTGTSLMRIERKNLDWGQAQWIKPLLNIMMDGGMGVTDYQCKQMLGDRYHRLAPVFPFPADQVIGLDAVDRIPDLVRFAETVDLSQAVKWLKATW